MDFFQICSTRPCHTESILGTCGYSECPFFHSPAVVAYRIARGCPPPRFCSEITSSTAVLTPPCTSLRPPTAVVQTLPVVLPSVTKRPRRMSMHPRKAAIVRFDARIGASLSSAAVLFTEASVLLATSQPSAAIPSIASETPARADKVSSNLVRPSDEALRPFDSLFGHLVRIGSFS